MSGTKQPPRRSRLLLAEDHKATAEQLRTLLQPDFDVVAVVPDGLALVSAASRLAPDVIVTDISMPGLDGIDATAQIRRSSPDTRIVLVTVHSEQALVQRGLTAGALGYVLKDAAGDELIAAVHAALRGERYVCHALGPHPGQKRPD